MNLLLKVSKRIATSILLGSLMLISANAQDGGYGAHYLSTQWGGSGFAETLQNYDKVFHGVFPDYTNSNMIDSSYDFGSNWVKSEDKVVTSTAGPEYGGYHGASARTNCTTYGHYLLPEGFNGVVTISLDSSVYISTDQGSIRGDQSSSAGLSLAIRILNAQGYSVGRNYSMSRSKSSGQGNRGAGPDYFDDSFSNSQIDADTLYGLARRFVIPVEPGQKIEYTLTGYTQVQNRTFSNATSTRRASSQASISFHAGRIPFPGGVTVTGRAVDAVTGESCSSATASLQGRSDTTGETGEFKLEFVSLQDGNRLTIQKDGYIPRELSVPTIEKRKAIDMGDIMLSPLSDKPVVTDLLLQNPEGVYLRGLSARDRPIVSTPLATATVDWNGCDPDKVEWWADGVLLGSSEGIGPVYTMPIAIDGAFPPSTRPHELKVIAKAVPSSDSEIKSAPHKKEVKVVSLPDYFQPLVDSFTVVPEHGVNLDFAWSAGKDKITPLILEDFAGDFGVKGSFGYEFSGGKWEVLLGAQTEVGKKKVGRRPKLRLKGWSPRTSIANREIEAFAYMKANGGVTRDPFLIKGIGGGMNGSFKGELGRFSPLDLFGPGATAFLSRFGLDDIMRDVSIIVWLTSEVDGNGMLDLERPRQWDAELEVSIGLEAAYNPKPRNKFKMKAYIGGKGEVGMKYPVRAPASTIFERGRLIAYSGCEVTAWAFSYDVEYELVLIDIRSGGMSRLSSLLDTYQMDDGRSMSLQVNPLKGNEEEVQWKPMARKWRESAGNLFVSGTTGGKAVAEIPRTQTLNDQGERTLRLQKMAVSDDQMLVQNVFPDSAPALAVNGSKMMLLFARDSGAEDPVNFTEVAWSHFDGNSWSAPAPVSPTTGGQFAPQISFDGCGAAIAVWEEIATGVIPDGDVNALAAKMEIRASRWDPETATWEPSAPLTNNAILDHSCEMTGSLANGNLFVTWRENASNIVTGTPSSPSRLLGRRWNSTNASWDPVQIIFDELSGESTSSIAAGGNKAVCVVSRSVAGEEDRELFYRIYDSNLNAWGTVTQYTSNGVEDDAVKVKVDEGGGIYAVWVSGDSIVMDRNLAGSPQIVRESSRDLGIQELALALSPTGKLALLWQQMGDAGPDAFFRAYDSASGTWGLDKALSQDSALERAFAPVFNQSEELVFAYENAVLAKVTKTVTRETGETVAIENVPEEQRVDLRVTKKVLTKDIALMPGSLEVSVINPPAGESVTVKASVLNGGDSSVGNISVSFHDGDPQQGGTLIRTIQIPGRLKANEQSNVRFDWLVTGEPTASRSLFATVVSSDLTAEKNQANNVVSTPLTGTDLRLVFVSSAVTESGMARVVLRVTNLGAPASQLTTLRVNAEEGAASYGTVNLPPLEPGESMDIPISLTSSIQEGEHSFRVVAGSSTDTWEIDPDDNEIHFSLNHWVDADGDGVPRKWEYENGLSDDWAEDANQDYDRDGFTNLQEYLAGTNPFDAQSKLRMGEVAQKAFDGGSAFSVSWPSVQGRVYQLERSYDLKTWELAGPSQLATPPLNTFIDTTMPPAGRAFYRLGARK